jgi:ferredoxin
MAFNIKVTDDCTGCSACVAVCDNFKMNDANKAEAVQAHVDDIGCNEAAKDACPVSAIVIEEA